MTRRRPAPWQRGPVSWLLGRRSGAEDHPYRAWAAACSGGARLDEERALLAAAASAISLASDWAAAAQPATHIVMSVGPPAHA